MNIVAESVIEVSPSEVCLWRFKDRQPFEWGNLGQLAKEMKMHGQIVPVIARLTSEGSSFKYEIIAGERRWRAAEIANIKLKMIIKEMSNKDAFVVQSQENSGRISISEYSTGMGYESMINKKEITAKEIGEILHIERTSVYNLLSFAKVPKKIWNAVEDMSTVSIKTSATIRTLANKGDDYIDALIAIASQIREGIGSRKIERLVKCNLTTGNGKVTSQSSKIVESKKGEYLFTWRNKEENQMCFSNEIIESINLDRFLDKIQAILEDEIDQP